MKSWFAFTASLSLALAATPSPSRAAEPPAKVTTIYEIDFEFFMVLQQRYDARHPTPQNVIRRVHPRGMIEDEGIILEVDEGIVHQIFGQKNVILFRATPEKDVRLRKLYEKILGTPIKPIPGQDLDRLKNEAGARPTKPPSSDPFGE